MPATRRRRRYTRIGPGLTDDQRQHLECGHDYFGSGHPFANDAERRACWVRHRRAILQAWDLPGRRPQAMWDYDEPDALEDHGSEAAAVHALLANAAERRLIELEWLKALEIAAFQATKPEYVVDLAVGQYGVALLFAERHAPEVIAMVARDRRDPRRGEVVPIPDARLPPKTHLTSVAPTLPVRHHPDNT